MDEPTAKAKRSSSLAAVISDLQTEFDHVRFSLISGKAPPSSGDHVGSGGARLSVNGAASKPSWVLSPMNRKAFKDVPLSMLSKSAAEADLDETFRTAALNRFLDILPYERRRVRLPVYKGAPMSAYINASYVHGPDGSGRAYIAAMAPKNTTVQSFWRMVWQERASSIVMLCQTQENGKEQCAQYWGPSVGNKVKVADMLITTTRVVNDTKKHMVRTVLSVSHPSGETRTVQHFWYKGWSPENDIPKTADQQRVDPTKMLALINHVKLYEQQHGNGGPIVVHCTAGVGRTGCFIAIDHICQLLEANQKADTAAVVRALREDRTAMVPTLKQYEFVQVAAIVFAKMVGAQIQLEDTAAGSPTTLDPASLFLSRQQLLISSASSNSNASDSSGNGKEKSPFSRKASASMMAMPRPSMSAVPPASAIAEEPATAASDDEKHVPTSNSAATSPVTSATPSLASSTRTRGSDNSSKRKEKRKEKTKSRDRKSKKEKQKEEKKKKKKKESKKEEKRKKSKSQRSSKGGGDDAEMAEHRPASSASPAAVVNDDNLDDNVVLAEDTRDLQSKQQRWEKEKEMFELDRRLKQLKLDISSLEEQRAEAEMLLKTRTKALGEHEQTLKQNKAVLRDLQNTARTKAAAKREAQTEYNRSKHQVLHKAHRNTTKAKALQLKQALHLNTLVPTTPESTEPLALCMQQAASVPEPILIKPSQDAGLTTDAVEREAQKEAMGLDLLAVSAAVVRPVPSAQ